MADNVTLPATGALVSTDEVTTVNGATVPAQQVQRMKAGWGGSSFFFTVTPTQPLPVFQAGSGTFAPTTVTTSATANTNTVLLAASLPTDTSNGREAVVIYNGGTVPLVIGLGFATTATVRSVVIPAGLTYEVPPAFAPAAINGQASLASQSVTFSVAA